MPFNPESNPKLLPTPEDSEARQAEVGRQIAERLPTGSLASWWGERVAKTPDNLVLRTDRRSLTYGELDALTDRVARVAYRMGLRRGQVVALQLPSSAAFLALILGLGKIGLRLSLLSPSLRGGSLHHALKEIPPRIVFTTPSSHAAIRNLEGVESARVVELQVEPADLAPPSDSGLAQIEAWLEGLEGEAETGPDSREWEAAVETQSPDETLFYIFTSGTTGLPKATQCSHRRYLAGGTSEGVLFGMGETDCMYVFLPMFHIAALSSIGAALSVSASIVIRPRFSASGFWDDVRRFSVTHFQYLGEIIRYLLAQPPRENDRPNSLRGILGAGLTLQSWRAFDERFGPLRIVESYGSSEGVIGIFNLDGVAGSVGRPPAAVEARLRIVRYDLAADELERDRSGHLVVCPDGESGELIAKLESRSQFEGYSSEAATRSKLLENAFVEGDLWYRSGDLFRKEEGYYFFVSRLGETYRWKGENVSAAEVTNALCACESVAHATVYPVSVPGNEGSAGMALITLQPGRELFGDALFSTLSSELPAYALPLFLRVGDGQGVLTETYKLGMATLKAQGYSPTNVKDPLYLLDRGLERYVPLTDEALRRVGLSPFDSVETSARGDGK